MNLLKNPEFLLDVAKSASLDSALSVISQAFIDGCSIGQTYITRVSSVLFRETTAHSIRYDRYLCRIAPPTSCSTTKKCRLTSRKSKSKNVLKIESNS